MMAGDAEPTTEVVAGIFLVCHRPARVLFDTGSTHSFASSAFMHGVMLQSESMSIGLSVETPGGRYWMQTESIGGVL